MLNTYLDTNVYIIGLLQPNTNSAKILEKIKKIQQLIEIPNKDTKEALKLFDKGNKKKFAGKLKAALNYYYEAYEINPHIPRLRNFIISTLQALERDNELDEFLKNKSVK